MATGGGREAMTKHGIGWRAHKPHPACWSHKHARPCGSHARLIVASSTYLKRPLAPNVSLAENMAAS